MPTKHALNVPPGTIEYDPSRDLELAGWKDMSMRAAATTTFATGLLDLQGLGEIAIALRTVPVGGAPTTGTVKLTMERYDSTGQILLQRLDIVTLINNFLSTATVMFLLRMGGGRVAARSNTSAAGADTAALGTLNAGIESFGALAKTKFIWEITTTNNAGTSAIAQGYIFGTPLA
jgi:hypothetical protein